MTFDATVDGVKYVASGFQYVRPVITSTAAWQSNTDNSLTWTAMARTASTGSVPVPTLMGDKSEYMLLILDGNGNMVWPKTNAESYLPREATSSVIPAGTFAPGTYQVLLPSST